MFFLLSDIIADGNDHSKKVTVLVAVVVLPLLSVTFTDKVKLFDELIVPKSIFPALVTLFVVLFTVTSYLLIVADFFAVALVIVTNNFDKF